MAKGGCYLAKNRGVKDAPKGKKKGRGWKIALIVFAVLVILAGAAYFVVSSYLTRMLNLVNRAEIEDRGASVEDILEAARYNPDRDNPELEIQVPSETETRESTTETTLPVETDGE